MYGVSIGLCRLLTVFAAELCADILERIEALHIYPDHSGPLPKLFELMREADPEGKIALAFFKRLLKRGDEQKRRIYYVDQILVSLMTSQTAQWLIHIGATDLICELAPYCRGSIREMFRPHSGGVIDAQDESSKAYREEESKQEESRSRHIKMVQENLLSRTSLNDALKDFWELKEDYWPELPDTYLNWLASEISKQMTILDLENTIQWKDNTLWSPIVLELFLQLIDRYALRIEPDEPLVFVLTGWDTGVVAKYHKRFPLSETALKTLERLLKTPASSRALEGLVRFLESTEIWTPEIDTSLKGIASSTVDQGYLQVTALNLLVKHGINSDFIGGIAHTGANQDLRNYAFGVLIEQQHRPSIKGALARLTDNELKAGNVSIPDTSPLGWLVKVKSNFVWDKLANLRVRALKLELPMLVGLITEALVRVDRGRTAALIRQQAELAPQGWRAVQVAQAIEQERTAKIEAAQRTPFDEVLKRLKGSTSINRLKVLCEGPSDHPVFKSLVGQIGTISDIIFDSVGG